MNEKKASDVKRSARPKSRPAAASKAYDAMEASEKAAAASKTAGKAPSVPAPNENAASAEKKRSSRSAKPQKAAKPLSPQARARMVRKRKKRIKLTLILLLVLVFCGAAGFGIVYLLRGGNFTELTESYTVSSEFSSDLSQKEELKAVPFAADLCVVSEDVPLETAALGDDQHGLLVDMDRKRVLYAQGACERIYPASITKIMTALLVLKYADLNENVTITEEDLNLEQDAQVCGFSVGDTLTMEQLLYCLLVYSGNDAAAAIARTIAGNETDFVSMMNTYAKQLGCTGTHFTNPHGLQDEDHYTTAYDIYLMLNEAYKYPVFPEITQLPGYTLKYTKPDGTDFAIYLEATDHYLIGEATPPKDVTVLGGKTGTTTEAGNCLALISQNAYGHPFVSVVLGAATKDVLYQEMNSLLQVINDPV